MTKKQIVALLKQFPFEVHAVGGAVRDIILGREPNDIDLATPLTPTQVVAALSYHWAIKVVNTEERYGLCRIKIDDEDYELMTFRSDFNTDGRHAHVKYVSTIEEDLGRRDLTINAMAMNNRGDIIDPFLGQDDIYDRIIRFVGDPYDRLEEDSLRVMRAIRFMARLDFSLSDDTREALINFQEIFMDKLKVPGVGLSWERILAEFDKAFHDEKPSIFLHTLKCLGYLDSLVPEFTGAELLSQSPEWHPEGDVWTHTLHVVDAADPEIRWEALLHDVGKVPAAVLKEEGYYSFHQHEKASEKLSKDIGNRFKMSNDRIKRLTLMTGLHMRPQQIEKDNAIRRFQYEAGDHLEDLKKLHRADVVDKPSGFHDAPFAELHTPVKRIVEGRDFMALGVAPGVELGLLVKKAHELQLDLGLSDKAGIIALTMIKKGLE